MVHVHIKGIIKKKLKLTLFPLYLHETLNRISDHAKKDRQRSRDAKNIVHVIPEMQPTEQTLRPSINSESVRMAFHSLSLFLSLSLSSPPITYLSISISAVSFAEFSRSTMDAR